MGQGADAAEYMLNTDGDDITLIPDDALPPEPEQQRETPASPNGKHRQVVEPGDPLSEEEIAKRCIDHIPNGDAAYDDWLTFLAACHSVNPNGEMQAAALRWSQQSTKHEQQKFDTTWKSFKRSHGNVATLGALVHLAKQHGFDVYEDRRRELRKRHAGRCNQQMERPRSRRSFLAPTNIAWRMKQ